MIKQIVGDLAYIGLYEWTPWGVSDEIKRNYLVDPSDFRGKDFNTTGSDTLDSKTSRHKESLIGLREDEDHDLVNLLITKKHDRKNLQKRIDKGSGISCEGLLDISQQCSGPRSMDSTWSSALSMVHDKQGDNNGVPYQIVNKICFGNSTCADVVSIPFSFGHSLYAASGGNNYLISNPFTGGIIGSIFNKQNNYNRATEGIKESSVDIGGKFYIDDVEQDKKFMIKKMINSEGKVVERVYGAQVITTSTAEKEKAKYFRNCLKGIQQCK
jgi:hypothetical protein